MKNDFATKFFEKSQDVWTVSKSDWHKDLFLSSATFNKYRRTSEIDLQMSIAHQQETIKGRRCFSAPTENQDKLSTIEA